MAGMAGRARATAADSGPGCRQQPALRPQRRACVRRVRRRARVSRTGPPGRFGTSTPRRDRRQGGRHRVAHGQWVSVISATRGHLVLFSLRGQEPIVLFPKLAQRSPAVEPRWPSGLPLGSIRPGIRFGYRPHLRPAHGTRHRSPRRTSRRVRGRGSARRGAGRGDSALR